MTKYLVQTATAFTGWHTHREHDSIESAQRSAHSLDRCGGWVRIIDSNGTYIEGRTDVQTDAMRAAYFAKRRVDASAS